MRNKGPYLCIDFGTSESRIACFFPSLGRAQELINQDGEFGMPSVIYWGKDEILVGKSALACVANDPAERKDFIDNIKARLGESEKIALSHGDYSPIELCAKILARLKRDAELEVDREIDSVVLTHPADSYPQARKALEKAAALAGFEPDHVHLLAEPIAAAVAYVNSGKELGGHTLVYDLGAGTFDVTVLARSELAFEVVVPALGIRDWAGNQFDLRLYERLEAIAREQLGLGFSADNTMHHRILARCRERKENLSQHEKCKFTDKFRGKTLESDITREEFEEIIREDLQEHSIRLTEQFIKEAQSLNKPVDTIVLAGRSSRIPLVRRLLEEMSGLEVVHDIYLQEFAIVLGGAYYAYQLANAGVSRADRPTWFEVARPVDASLADVWCQLEGWEQELSSEVVGSVQFRRHISAHLESRVHSLKLEYYTRRELLMNQLSRRSYTEALNHLEVMLRVQPDDLELAEVKKKIGKRFADSSCLTTISTRQIRKREFGFKVRSVAWSPDGNEAAFVGDNNTLTMLGGDDLSQIQVLSTHDCYEVGSVAWEPSGDRIATGGRDNTIRISSRDGQANLWVLKHSVPITSLVWLECETRPNVEIASGDNLGRICIWNTERNSPIQTLSVHQKEIRSLSVSPDGKQMLSASSDGTVRLWDVATSEQIMCFGGHKRGATSACFFPGNGLALTSGFDGNVRLWDSNSGDEVLRYEGLTHAANAVAFSRDGRLVLAASKDGNVWFWDTCTHAVVHHYRGHTDEIRGIAVSPDGTRVLTASFDGTVKLWGLRI